MLQEEYEVIFVVLTYRNVSDLSEFIESTNNQLNFKYKIVVVNSYFDEPSSKILKEISLKNNCDFLEVENRGYGYGNNKGIQFARSNYKFKYLVISNPDIEIQRFSIDQIEDGEDCIFAPKIVTLKGKKQNPYYYSKIEIVEWLHYYSCRNETKIFSLIGIIINKIYREIHFFIDNFFNVKIRKIYACHGSFIIIGSSAIEKLGQIYDENMFLFSEENHFARLALSKSIPTYIIYDFCVLHKEDGSVGLEKINNQKNRYKRESFIYYYENWKKKK